MNNKKQLTRQVAETMHQSRRFYRPDGLATAMGLRPHEVEHIFTELQENPVYTLRIRQRPFTVQVTAISDNLTVTPFDAEHNIARRQEIKNTLWNSVLYAMPAN